MARVLVVDDEPGFRDFLHDALALRGHDVEKAADGVDAIGKLGRRNFQVLVTDLKMPRLDGLELLKWVRAKQPEVEVIVLTAHGSVGAAVEAMKAGALDFLEKPIESPDALRILVERAAERHRLKSRVEEGEEGEIRLSYGSKAMEATEALLKRVAPTEATVLLSGASGTGKEVAAKAVHRWSKRSANPFIAVNCAALAENLLESELFGHEQGAFTGATARRRGRIELADSGTLFLDEVGELKPELQTKLLRVLQERKFERVGGEQTIESDVRWIAATNRDLLKMVSEGKFREDLYHRLAVFPVRMPNLAERREDIPELASTLLTRIAAGIGKPFLTLSEEAKRTLSTSDWPGNVRQLANTLERAAIMAEGETVGPENPALSEIPNPNEYSRENKAATLTELERDAIKQALNRSEGNRKRAAEALGIGLRTLYEKLKRYGLE